MMSCIALTTVLIDIRTPLLVQVENQATE
jgi:hypothetical protein